MKIALLVPNFVEFDGAGRAVELQAAELAAAGHEVAIFTLAATLTPPGVKVNVMGMPRSLFWERIYRLIFPLDIIKTLRWLPRLKGYDEVIVHLYPLTWLAWLAKKRYGMKYTFWYHGIMPPHLFPHLYERIYMKLQILMTRLTVGNADRLVAVSRFSRDELKQNTGREGEVIYNTVDTSRYHSRLDGQSIRDKYGLGQAPVLLFVGALRPVKGVYQLIQAFNLVRQDIPDARLLLVGRPDYPYYFKECRQISDDSVIFAGFVPDEELPHCYAACDIYATCSLWENHNVPALHAQACHKPVVAWHPSFGETMSADGILVEAGNLEAFARACAEKLHKLRETGGGNKRWTQES